MRKGFLVFCLVICFAGVACGSNGGVVVVKNDEENENGNIVQTIKTTNDDFDDDGWDGGDPGEGWVRVKDDESVPRGSYIRMNIATGDKYRKLEEGEPVPIKKIQPAKEKTEGPQEVMERVLRGLPNPDSRLPSAEDKKRMSPEEYEAALKKIWDHRQKEITAAMEAMEDHATIIQNFTEELLNANLSDASAPDLVQSLENLEWIVQDIDQATHFISLGGMDICHYLLSHNDPMVRTNVAYVIGSAIKNDPNMQEKSIQVGVLSKLISNLNEMIPCNSGSEKECGKVLYAIASSVRGFEPGQQMAMNEGLHLLLVDLLEIKDLDSRILTKVLALISDSFVEWETCSANWSVNNTSSRLCIALNDKTVDGLNESLKQKLSFAKQVAQCV